MWSLSIHHSLLLTREWNHMEHAWFLILVRVTDFCYTLPLYTSGYNTRIASFWGSHTPSFHHLQFPRLSEHNNAFPFENHILQVMKAGEMKAWELRAMKAGEMKAWELRAMKAGDRKWQSAWELQVMKAHAISLCGLTIRQHILVV